MTVFLSYHFADARFVQSIHYYLTKQSDLTPYFYGDELRNEDGSPKKRDHWFREVSKALSEANAFFLFLGEKLGKTQFDETMAAINRDTGPNIVLVKLPGAKMPKDLHSMKRALRNAPPRSRKNWEENGFRSTTFLTTTFLNTRRTSSLHTVKDRLNLN
jgi:hypothetical protein